MTAPNESPVALTGRQKTGEVPAKKPGGLGLILGGMILAIVLISQATRSFF
jgi:hypothetical protein